MDLVDGVSCLLDDGGRSCMIESLLGRNRCVGMVGMYSVGCSPPTADGMIGARA